MGQSHAEEWASLCELGLNTTCFVPRSYHIYPGYPGHGYPCLSWPWRQALGHWRTNRSCSVSTLGAMGAGVGSCCLPSRGWVGPHRTFPDFSVCPPVSPPPTTWSSPGELVHNHVQLCAAHTCAGKGNYGRRHLQLLPSPSSPPFPSPLPLLLFSHSGLKDRTGSSPS